METMKGVLAGLTAASIWGGMYVVSKVVLEVIPPFGLLSLRLSLACLFLGGWQAVRRASFPTRSGLSRLLFVGAVGFGISLGLQFVGTRLSTAANAALVTSASPLFMVLFAVILLEEKANQRRMVALFAASLGVLAVLDPNRASLNPRLFQGNLALLGAAVAWGLYSVLARAARRWAEPTSLSLYTIMGGLVLALPAAALEASRSPWGVIDGPILLGILYLGLVSTAFAVYLWTRSLAVLEAGLVSLLFFAQPVVGAGLGALLLDERLGLGFWVGAVLIALGLLLEAGGHRNRRPALAKADGGDKETLR